MDKYQDKSNNLTPRENFLMSLLNKIIKEYKAVLEYTRRTKPFKIIEILYLTNIPGETKFAVQITNKDSILNLTAAEIISLGYNLSDFNEFHAEMIKQAALGKLLEFLSISNKEPTYKIVSKKYDKETQQNIFLIEVNQQTLARTANELCQDTQLLSRMDFNDILDIGYTQGSESVLKEKIALLLAKNK